VNDNDSKFDLRCQILTNKEIAQSHFQMEFACPEIAAIAKPGQFIHLLIDPKRDPLLRRPFTIYKVKNDSIEILFQVVGRGSHLLSQKHPGNEVRVMGPLGNSFLIPDELDIAILVGGGIGVASLMMLAEELQRQGVYSIGLIGAQNCERILCVNEFQESEVEVYLATDDGSCGYHGFVTELLNKILSNPQGSQINEAYGKQKWAKRQKGKRADELDDKNVSRFAFHYSHIYACGPDGMLKSTAEIATKFHLPAQLALENRMACGVGACLGCVLKLKSADDDFEYKRACVEGPIFNAQEIIWD